MVISALERPDPSHVDPRHAVVGELVHQCGWGDESALADLFDRTYFLVVAVVRAAGRSSGREGESAAAVLNAYRWIWHRSPHYVEAERGAFGWLVDHVLDSLDPAVSGPVAPAPIDLGATG